MTDNDTSTRASLTFGPVFMATFVLTSSLSLGLFYATYDPVTRVNVRWDEQVTESRREELEIAYLLSDPRAKGDRTWSYGVRDTPNDNIGRLVRDPATEDTAGIDRENFELKPSPAPFVLFGPAALSILLGGIVSLLFTNGPAVLRQRIRIRIQSLETQSLFMVALSSLTPTTSKSSDAPQVSTKEDFNRIYFALATVSVFSAYYVLFLNQGLGHTGPLGNFLSETPNHINFSIPFLRGRWLDELKTNFEPLLHILTASTAYVIQKISNNEEALNFANAAALVLSTSKVAQFIIVRKIIGQNTNLSASAVLFLTTVASVCTVIYLPFITLNIYMPMSTPNMLVDPTNILLGPFAIAFFYIYIRHYIDSVETSYRLSFYLSLLLFAATLVKPAFTNIMLVVVGIYYLSHLKRFVSSSIGHDVFIYLPSCILLIWQLFLILNSTAGGSVEFAPYRVIEFYTSHPWIALFQAIGFPLAVAVTRGVRSDSQDSSYLGFAWLFCAIAYAIYALFAFAGPNARAANLAWSYQIGLLLLYLFIIVEYAKIVTSDQTRVDRVLTNICTIGFCLVFLSGVHQFVKIFLGGFYF
jgi:hypothetical protein